VAAVPAPPASAAASALQAPQLTPLGDRWAALVRRLQEQGRIAALVRELALQAGALSCEEDGHGDTWTLVVERESLRTPALVEKLQAALAAELGRAQQLRLQPGVPGDSLARRDAWERQQRQLEAERRIRDDPAVTELLAQFKTARIVPGSIRPL
jgi:DNA polymerase-3 subunit gamma/tau